MPQSNLAILINPHKIY